MADESGKPKKSGSPYIPIAVALFIGIVIGGALFSSDDVEETVERQLSAAQNEMNEQLAAARSEVDEQITAARGEIDEQITAIGERADAAGEEIARLDPVEEGLAALDSAGEEISARLDSLGESVEESMSAQTEAGERVEFLESRVQTMAGQMSQIVSRLQEVESRPAAASAMGSSETGDEAAAEEPADSEPEPASTASLGFGQVGSVGGTQVFVSRLDAGAGEVGVMTLDGRSGTVGMDAPFDLGDDCSLMLTGIEDGTAQLASNCAS